MNPTLIKWISFFFGKMHLFSLWCIFLFCFVFLLTNTANSIIQFQFVREIFFTSRQYTAIYDCLRMRFQSTKRLHKKKLCHFKTVRSYRTDNFKTFFQNELKLHRQNRIEVSVLHFISTNASNVLYGVEIAARTHS